MKISEYENYHEKINRHDPSFPYQTYPCSIPQDFEQVPLHWHEEMEMIYIKKGQGIIMVDFARLVGNAGDIFFLCPGQLHGIMRRGKERMEYENIIFPLSILGNPQTDELWESYIAPVERRQKKLCTCLSRNMEGYAAISACIDRIDEIRSSFPPGYPLMIKGKLFELFFFLYHYGLAADHGPADNMGRRSRERSLEKSRQILTFVETHYQEHISIEALAMEIGFSASHFMKFFKQTFGLPFTAYLNSYRLTMASRLLLASEDSILTVALESGFENLSYFNRRFKEKFGITPREFRERNGSSPV